MTSKHILIVDIALPNDKEMARFGKYSDWFKQAVKAIAPEQETLSIPVEQADADLLAGAGGIILSGAEAGVYDVLPWRERFDGILRELIDSGPPILGVCFSHQYLSELLGGRIEPSPSGAEMGFHTLTLSEEGRRDPLYAGIDREFTVIETHNDAVVEPPPGAVLLASSPRLRYQSFRCGERAWTVQYHPEMTGEIANYIIDELGTAEDQKSGKIIRKSDDHPHVGLKIISNFIGICLMK